MAHSYWGTGFSDADCLSQVRQFRLPDAVVVDNPAAAAAADLVAGRLVGWLQGRSEFGQRALGNRSILADPRRADAKDVVNAAVKYRESFRSRPPSSPRRWATGSRRTWHAGTVHGKVLPFRRTGVPQCPLWHRTVLGGCKPWSGSSHAAIPAIDRALRAAGGFRSC
jgi:hypothetical protein